MKKILLKILFIILWILLAGGLIALGGYTMIIHQDVVCRNFTIDIDYGKADVLITKDDIYNLITKTGFLLKGQPIRYIDPEKIENTIRRQTYVAGAQVYLSMEGDVSIRVIQRQPILRVFNQKGESYYIDGKGKVLPLNPDFAARVLVANGYIDEPLHRNLNYSVDSVRVKDSLEYRSVINNLFRVATYIVRDPFLKAQIEQIYVEKNGEMELVPRVGNNIILFGNADDIAGKFTRLYIFYRMGLSRTGWNRYPVINIKYKQQVVCSKI